MLLVVGEAITAFMRKVQGKGPNSGYDGPFPSGAPMIFASAAARLGIKTVALMGVGADAFGVQMSEVLKSHGVDVSHCVVSKTKPTACAFVTYYTGGTREFIFYLNNTAATEVPAAALERLPEVADFLYVSGSTLGFGGALSTTTEEALARAKQAKIKIFVDPNVREETASAATLEQVRAAVLVADYVLPSKGELEALGLSVVGLMRAGKTVIMKGGAQGAKVFSSEGEQSVTAPKVTEVNADGAGDIFAATFVAATMKGSSSLKAAELACQIAARSVTSTGPMNSFVQPSDLVC